jgi:hypothetical protein
MWKEIFLWLLLCIPLKYYEWTVTNSCLEEAHYFVPELEKCAKDCPIKESYTFNLSMNYYKEFLDQYEQWIGSTINCEDKTTTSESENRNSWKIGSSN